MNMSFELALAENKLRQERHSWRIFPPVDMSGDLDMERCRSDFRYWAARCVKIRDKRTGATVPFILNRAQEYVLREIENLRMADRPIRLIILKARQWGSSTLMQVYMAWIQLIHKKNWHSVICAHHNDASRTIRGMYSTLLAEYPPEAVESDDGKPYSFAGFERAQNIKVITGRDCRVLLMSAETQDAVRGSDFAMAHLSEVAFWKSTPAHNPLDLLRTISGSVTLEPMTFVVIESTANGVGNFFHQEWLRSRAGKSDKLPVFVPWYMIEIYSRAVDDPRRLWESLTPYELQLWHEHDCTLEQINWYRHKLAEYPSAESMHAEFPTTPEEAFLTTGANVFNNCHIEALRADCRTPRIGDLGSSGRFEECCNGNLSVWTEPQPDKSYIVAVDVGGRTAKADWSVMAVLSAGPRPEVVAQWRGHTDHDLLANHAVNLARWYNKALLVIESNSLERNKESEDSATVLTRVYRDYDNTYRRAGSIKNIESSPIGFHTNVKTKALIVNKLIEAVREKAYIERDEMACNELTTYSRLPNGSFAALDGAHDDIVMTRAIALYILDNDFFTSDFDLADLHVDTGW